MFFPQTSQTAPFSPTSTGRLPLRPSPGPELLPEPEAGGDWLWLLLSVLFLGLVLWLWVRWRQRYKLPPTPRETALAALDKRAPLLETDPPTAFIVVADILRQYWTATGQVAAETLTTLELVSALEKISLPENITKETLTAYLQQAEKVKFAGISVTTEQARRWWEMVREIVGWEAKDSV